MNYFLKKIRFILVLLLIFLGLISAKPVSAVDFQLSGSVTASSGIFITGATIDVMAMGTTNVVASAMSDEAGNYNITIPSGIYDIKLTPPSGSNFTPVLALNYTISSSTVLNFILVPAGTVSIAGRIYNGQGSALPNVRVELLNAQGTQIIQSTHTDALGGYSLVASSGTYLLHIRTEYGGLDPALHVWEFDIGIAAHAFTQSAVVDITLPTKQVTVHVQDATQTPVSGVAITSQGYAAFLVSSLNNNADGRNIYPTTYTDAEGNATLWLITGSANLTATPSSGGGYSSTISSISIMDDTQLTITLPTTILITGSVLNGQETPLSNVRVELLNSQGTQVVQATHTNSSGNYSLEAASGTYRLHLRTEYGGLDPALHVWEFDLGFTAHTFTQSTVVEFILPTKQVIVHAQDAAQNPLSGVAISSHGNANYSLPNININTDGRNDYPTTYTDEAGNATVWLMYGSANITATPPSGSGFSAITSSISIADDTQAIITLPMPISITGHVFNGQETSLANVRVELLNAQGSQVIQSTLTDAQGSYSFEVSSGTYVLHLRSNFFDSTVHMPDFDLGFDSHAFTQSAVVDITLPTKQVTVHVQDAAQNSLPNIAISSHGSANFSATNLNIHADGWNDYPQTYTDASGNAIVWLMVGSATFTAIPSSDSGYNQITVENTAITSDQTEIFSLQSNNHPPVITDIIGPSSPTSVNSVVNMSGSFEDIDTTNTHVAEWSWGDGTTSQGSIVEGNGSGSVSGTHTYSTTGVYTVGLTVVDNFNGSANTIYNYVVIYDPSAGFLTGAGQYESQTGWFEANPLAAGRVIFGINAKYTAGNTIPTGQTKIKFNDGDFDLSSTSYDWLVVTGAKAILQGKGTINGLGNYTFLISGIDGSQSGSPNFIRVKITDSSNNLVYDTQNGSIDTVDPIISPTSGSIKVH